MTAKLTEDAKGVFIIAATPFTDEGALDLRSVDTLTDFYLGCGVHGFTLLGMMGEAHKLTAEESLSVVNRVIDRAQGRQVIVGVSHAGLENVRRLSHEVMVRARRRDGGAARRAQGRRRPLQLLCPGLPGAGP
jgi:4-hydroxy-tetrahydrodipicolinate synthase